MMDFDVIIVGGGIAGSSLGAEIAGKRRTLIIEAEDSCAAHSTGRSAAFWLAHYGGPPIVPLSVASHPLLGAGWPQGERSFLRQRGALTIARQYRDLWAALSAETDKAPHRREVQPPEIERLVPGIRPDWALGLLDESCADIDVAGLHGACLAHFRRTGGALLTSSPLIRARRSGDRWQVDAGEETLSAATIVDAAGAWADEIARRCDVAPIGVRPYRRTIAQLRVARRGLAQLPLVVDALSRFYFKGESDNRVWVSPHDETASAACDAAPEEIDVARAIDYFESVVDWPVEAVERKWAGLRSFAPDRLPVYGFDRNAPGFFWCAGQGGFGIQTAPAAAKLAASVLLGETPDDRVAKIDPRQFSPLRF